MTRGPIAVKVSAGPLPPPVPPPSWAPRPFYVPVGWTRASIETIRRAIGQFEVVQGLSVALVLVAIGLLALIAAGSGWSLGPGGPPSRAIASPGAFLLLAGALFALAVAAFVFLLLSWVTWRSGLSSLASLGSEYGPEHADEVRRARSDSDAALVLYVVGLFAGTLGGTFLLSYASFAAGGFGFAGPHTMPQPWIPPVTSLVVGAVVPALISGGTYFFAGRSLARTVLRLLAAQEQARVERGRWWMVLGGVLSPAAGGPLLFALLYGGFGWVVALFAVVPPLAILHGLRQVASGYDAWIGPTVG